jgi:outer membrane protein OmpA-like peptidoglycan-associated protein
MKRSLLGVVSAALLLSSLVGCSNPQPGPDKTAAGMVLGAGWGAGSGVIIGHQLDVPGEGAAIGAGFGAVHGAITGAGYDLAEGAILKEKRELASLKVQNLANTRELAQIQAKLDEAAVGDLGGGVFQVFFDLDATSLKAGSVANLQSVADSLKRSPAAYKISVVGHADDSGNPEYNERLAESRARGVSALLGSNGISMDQITVSSFGSKRPLVTNTTAEGRQLNRRVDIFIGR